MKMILTPRRHAVPLKPGERLPTPDEVDAGIAAGRRRMVEGLKRYPDVRVLGIEGRGEILVELPDGDEDLKRRIKTELDVETGPAREDVPQMPVWRDLKPSPEAVAEAHAAKEYRPTIVAMVRDARGRFLFVQSKRDPDEWMFVQGGIEEGEPPLLALAREIREEIDVGPSYAAPSRYAGAADLDAEPGRADKRGFTKGKRYFIFEVAYRGPEELTLQAEEVSGYAWVEPRFDDPKLLEMLSRMRPGKAALIINAIMTVL